MRSRLLFLLAAACLPRPPRRPPTKIRPSRSKNAVDDLLSRMTLEEKVSQMMSASPAIPRLGIPAYNWWNECLHGVARAGRATVFPQAIGLAATWDSDLILRVATAISDEARAKNNEFVRRGKRGIYQGLTFWTPNINIFRDPRWGRGMETYGEDPYLTGRLAVQFIRGLQGDDPKYLKMVATAKHFAVHSGPESTRHGFDARVDDRDLLRHLPAAVRSRRHRGQGAIGDVRLQPRGRRSRLRQPAPARRHSAQAVGLCRVRGLRLRRHRRYLPDPQDGRDLPPRASPRRSRQAAIWIAASSTRTSFRAVEQGLIPRRTSTASRAPPADRALPARHVRPAVDGARGAGSRTA